MEITLAPATIDALFWMFLKVSCIGTSLYMCGTMIGFVGSILNAVLKK